MSERVLWKLHAADSSLQRVDRRQVSDCCKGQVNNTVGEDDYCFLTHSKMPGESIWPLRQTFNQEKILFTWFFWNLYLRKRVFYAFEKFLLISPLIQRLYHKDLTHLWLYFLLLICFLELLKQKLAVLLLKVCFYSRKMAFWVTEYLYLCIQLEKPGSKPKL